MAKAVINGKKYDTDNSIFVAEIRFKFGRDIETTYHRLYKTHKDNWFLVKFDNTYKGTNYEFSEFTEEEAKKWLKDNNMVNEYEDLFGPLEEA